MSLYDDIFYLRQVSMRLPRFSEASKNNFRFRCVLCGDSKKSASKTRGTCCPKAAVRHAGSGRAARP